MWIKKLLLILCLCSICQADWGSLENFTGYTEVDPGDDVTVAENTITWVDFNTRNTDTYVYRDKSAAHFNGDFSHRFKLNITSMVFNALFYPWLIANSIDDAQGLVSAGDKDFQGIHLYENTGHYYIRLSIIENGVRNDTGLTEEISLATDYYITVERDDDGGANNTGQLTCRVYTTNYYGEAGAVEVHTFTLDCKAGEQNDFRYLYATNSHNTGAANRLVSGTIDDLDLGEASPFVGGGQVIMVEEF